LLIQERNNWFLWLPVGMIIGIIWYFKLPGEPSLTTALLPFLGGLIALACLNFYIRKDLPILRFCLYAFLSISLGFLGAKIRVESLQTHMLTVPLKDCCIEGNVVSFEKTGQPDDEKQKNRVIIDVKKIAASDGGEHTTQDIKKIRLNLPNGYEPTDSNILGKIKCRANLMPLSGPSSLYSFNFKRHAFFQGISAVGRIISFTIIPDGNNGQNRLLSKVASNEEMQGTYVAQNRNVHGVHEDSSNGGTRQLPLEVEFREKSNMFDKIRHNITQSLRANMPGTNGEIAAALITGDRSGIPHKVRQNFTDAGIAHILAISGLHISLVAAIIFFAIRRLLILIPPALTPVMDTWAGKVLAGKVWLAEAYNTKKMAAVFAIIATFIYLAISGFGFPAIRAFIMITILMIGVLKDIKPISIRSIAIAAVAILLIYPESALSTSFQLSFAAVTGLIAAFNNRGPAVFKSYLGRKLPKISAFIFNNNLPPYFNIPRKIFLYGAGIVITTVVATLSTTPLIITTFNRFTVHAIMGNLVAIPLISLWIMPVAILATMSTAWGGNEWLFKVLGMGIQKMCQSAAWVASQPGAAILIPTPHPLFLWLVMGGFLWLCLWQMRWRFLGLIPIALGCLLLFYKGHQPLFFMAGDASVMAFPCEQNDSSGYLQNTPKAKRILYVSDLKRGKFHYEQWGRELGITNFRQMPRENFALFPPGKPLEGKILVFNDYLTARNLLDGNTGNLKDSIIVSNNYLKRPIHDIGKVCIDKNVLLEKGAVIINQDFEVVFIKQEMGTRPWS